jgi:hypothetical protein
MIYTKFVHKARSRGACKRAWNPRKFHVRELNLRLLAPKIPANQAADKIAGRVEIGGGRKRAFGDSANRFVCNSRHRRRRASQRAAVPSRDLAGPGISGAMERRTGGCRFLLLQSGRRRGEFRCVVSAASRGGRKFVAWRALNGCFAQKTP